MVPKNCSWSGRVPPALALCKPRFSAPACGRTCSEAQLSSSTRRGSRPVAGWPVVGACRPHASAFRRRVCARKSHDRFGCTSGSVSRLERATPGAVLSCPAGGSCSALAGCDNPRVVLLTPGSAERDLFRAFVSGALPRLHTGRRGAISPFAIVACS